MDQQRRNKRKLRILEETEGLNELLFDLIDLVNPSFTDEQKISIIKDLEKSYKDEKTSERYRQRTLFD